MITTFNAIGLCLLFFTGIYFLLSDEMVEGWLYGIMTLAVAGQWITNIIRNEKD